MKHTIFISIVLSIILFGCNSIEKSGLLLSPSIVAIPDTVRTHLEIDTSRKLEGVSTKKKFLGFTVEAPSEFCTYSEINEFGNSGSLNQNLREAAVYNALLGTKYDILVMPKFLTYSTRSIFGSKTVVKVTGFGASQYITK
jgi:hypothetical protein